MPKPIPIANSESPLLVRPRVAWHMLGCGNTRGYQLIASGELETFLDGSARKITVASIHAFIARKLAASGPDGKPVAPRSRKARANSSGADQGRVTA
jgi:hypothetical protein